MHISEYPLEISDDMSLGTNNDKLNDVVVVSGSDKPEPPESYDKNQVCYMILNETQKNDTGVSDAVNDVIETENKDVIEVVESEDNDDNEVTVATQPKPVDDVIEINDMSEAIDEPGSFDVNDFLYMRINEGEKQPTNVFEHMSDSNSGNTKEEEQQIFHDLLLSQFMIVF